jgi:hypothetical protein
MANHGRSLGRDTLPARPERSLSLKEKAPVKPRKPCPLFKGHQHLNKFNFPAVEPKQEAMPVTQDYSFVLKGLVLMYCAAVSSSALASEVSLERSGQEVVLYHWGTERCFDWHITDAHLRAFRRNDGKVVAYASSDKNIPFIGDDLLSIKTTCASAFRGKGSSDPSDHSDASWITATWTDNGKDVVALVHDEFHAYEHPGACRFNTVAQCWYNVVTFASSYDGGLSFRSPEPPILVAGPAMPQEPDQGRPIGFFNPSNIFKYKAHNYVMIYTPGGGEQSIGGCLFRTLNIHDPTAWRAWDGEAFTVKPYDAYRPAGHAWRPCKPVAKFPHSPGSVVRHEKSGVFVAVLPHGSTAEKPHGFIAYSTSTNLTDWTPLQVALDLPSRTSRNCNETYSYGYPSLLDSNSSSRNFDTVGDDAYIFLTRFKMTACKGGKERDLVAIPIRIHVQ